MQTPHTAQIDHNGHAHPLTLPAPQSQPKAIEAGSRGIWKDTRTKPLAA